ncbi:acyltransferase, partial [Bacteroides fragilis]
FVLLTYSEWQKKYLHTEWYISVPILFSIIILLSLYLSY